ncbi:hypothetical protein SAMN02745885_02250 [Carboxydocella sporoproducens DSM 16521]|uniref:Uncharacterized protein n=2 Tax=Carboxydocella TaxID=178898 RepID=A0A1T4RT41_9FIRM|nr:hypothetical protein [Carboxydocella sp. ULO1]AVX20408.1 hypothetical protein CFE_1218 [Carboxydocella thermautotrophica]AVX30831.1 hypothetical protein CTH_1240 [Carboxydocella thermautotrophica]SKA19150.1 hypothetical protein SAMN02745885_02250 [Carboxydocella sporoproducens DSM 16521]
MAHECNIISNTCPQCGFKLKGNEMKCPRCAKVLIQIGSCSGACGSCNQRSGQ